MANPEDFTLLLKKISEGDRLAEEQLIPQIYPDLKRVAAAHLRRERPGHTLQPTALVNEAYVRLVGGAQVNWQGRSHFFRVAATMMRRILVDYARNNSAQKRTGGKVRVELDDFIGATDGEQAEILDVDRVLQKLEQFDERAAKIVEMRFYGGLSEEEIGDVLGLSERTVKRDWKAAKTWLKAELQG